MTPDDWWLRLFWQINKWDCQELPIAEKNCKVTVAVVMRLRFANTSLAFKFCTWERQECRLNLLEACFVLNYIFLTNRRIQTPHHCLISHAVPRILM